jgi:hypothetical protein
VSQHNGSRLRRVRDYLTIGAVPNLWRRLFYPDDTGAAGMIGDPLTPRQAALIDLNDATANLDAWSLPIVVAARTLIANTVASLPMIAVRDVPGEPDMPSLSPVQWSIVRRPDPSEPYRSTLERIVLDMTRYGGAWLRVTAIGSNGYPLAAEVIHPDRVQAEAVNYRIGRVTIDDEPQDLRRVKYLPMTLDRPPFGVSPLVEIDAALAQLAEVYRYAAGFYGANLPPYSVVHPSRLTEAQAQQLRDQWLVARAQRTPAILSGGVAIETYNPTTAADAMLIDALDALDATVARVLHIPPSLLNTLAQSSLTYSTTSGEFARWLTLGLYPAYLARIEAAFSDMLPRGNRAVFDTRNITRDDLTGDELGAPVGSTPAPLPLSNPQEVEQ